MVFAVKREKMMKKSISSLWILRILMLLGASAMSHSALAVDEAAALQVARQNNCFNCHAVSKEKDGPPYKAVAAKYKDKPGAEARLMQHLTTGEKAKFADGHEEQHKIVKTKDEAELRNLVAWILSR